MGARDIQQHTSVSYKAWTVLALRESRCRVSCGPVSSAVGSLMGGGGGPQCRLSIKEITMSPVAIFDIFLSILKKGSNVARQSKEFAMSPITI